MGDINQSVNPFSSSNLKGLQEIFTGATCMTMLKSYRSTYEITEFTRKIGDHVEVEPIERPGQEPEILRLEDSNSEVAAVQEMMADFRRSGHNSMGIICKTQEQAGALYDQVKAADVVPCFPANPAVLEAA
ncbi:MAG: hypothetical protein U5L96_09655 [Owenweeksia sp.]|nr:hypothetical protein [Owenweeksia sp.]